MILSLVAALLAWGLAVAALQALHAPPWPAFCAVLVALLAASHLIGQIPAPAAGGLGPKLSGLFAMFPVMSTVLVGFSHRASGPGFAVALLRGMVGGYYAFTEFCLVLALLLPGRAPGRPFVAATACALSIQFGVRAPMQASSRR